MKRALPIILAVALALVAAGLVFFYTRGAEQRVIDQQQPVPVLVSNALIPQGLSLGDAVAGGLVESTQVPSTMAPAGAISGVTAENTALVALNAINPGQILLSSNFVSELPAVSSIPIPDGQVAVSITLGDPQRVGNFVRPGAEVVVWATVAGSEGSQVVRVLLDRALVIGVGESTTAQVANADGTTTTAQAPSALLTFALGQTEAEKLIYASQSGSLYLGLLGEGTEIVTNEGTTDGNLFD
jgi:pilus assembly protein CpaB